MAKALKKKLLDIPEVVDEINRHLWLESEKVGYDIGFETAAQQWINHYAEDWVNYYMPPKEKKTKKEAKPQSTRKRTRGRSAKTHMA